MNRYLAVVFDEPTKQVILNRVPAKHPKIFAEHITLVYLPSNEEIVNFAQVLNTKVKFILGAEYSDDKGQALTVSLVTALPSFPSRKLHVTISTAEGTQPSYSNELLENFQNIKSVFNNPLVLDGTVRLVT